MAKSIFENFTNQYPVSKTLRFALEPVGETAECIKENKLLSQDEERAVKYKQAKKIIDEYHKDFIEKSLKEFSFDLEDLEQFQTTYNKLKKDNKNSDLQEELTKHQTKLRNAVAKSFKTGLLFKKEFIQKDLPEWLESHSINIEGVENPKEIIKEFHKWTTYFTGFNENRKNVYTKKEHSTGIAYRIVHDNLPKFIDNLESFKEAKDLEVDFSEVEANFEVDLTRVFSLSYFNQCLNQSGIDNYHLIRGGKSLASNKDQKRGVNQAINLHAQQLEKKKSKNKSNDQERKKLNEEIKKVRRCKLTELYKQILSDRSSLSFTFDQIESDLALSNAILNTFFLNSNKQLIGKKEEKDLETQETTLKKYSLSESWGKSLNYLEQAELDKVYLKNNISLTNISKELFDDWSIIKNALRLYSETLFPVEKKLTNKIEKQRRDWLDKSSYFSFQVIETALKSYFEQMDKSLEKEKRELLDHNNLLIHYFKTQTPVLEKEIKDHYPKAKKVLEEFQEEKEKLKSDKDKVLLVKNYLDSLMAFQHLIKPLYITFKNKREEKAQALEQDNGFYLDFNETYEVMEKIIPLFNQTRNYLTKKPFNTEKYKLNFNNTTLAAGWDKNKEQANGCILFLKDGRYFLGVMANNKLFEETLSSYGDCYQKVHYKLLPGASKMLPKVFFSDKNIGYYNPSEEIINIRNHASHTKSGEPKKGFEKKEFQTSDMHKMIDFFKISIDRHPEWKDFGFQFSKTSQYQDLSTFYREVEHQGYKITFNNISESIIDEFVASGKLYLFEIYSKDFSSKSKGNPNLQTLYWRALFDKNNLADVIYKLNGEAELFYRRASLKYSQEIWETGHHANYPKKKQPYPIIKDRRYAKDTFLFHVPISLGFKATGISKFNDKVNTILKNNPNVNILSLDRGERHLAYYTLINQQGEILEQESLNRINGVDYQLLLDEKEKERAQARENWGAVNKIKDLKAGYLSFVVYKIVTLMIKYNAIVVLEDLNFGFKQGRFKIEKQIYQKLEKMLIDKLNYLVLKDKQPKELGHVMKALQLTDKFTSFKKLGKQTGFIFYVPAYHTSKICPATGFVNLIYPRYETVTKAQEYFNRFNDIRYNTQKDYFEFDFNSSSFTNKPDSQDHWVVCTHGSRLENYKVKDTKNWDTQEVLLTSELKTLFDELNIDYRDNSLKEQITNQSERKFFKQLIRLLRLTLQMRNSRSGTEEDWLVSPVQDANGTFFDSRKASNHLPQDADANGAYHIGLKALLMLQQLKQAKKVGGFKADLSNKAWYEFVQKERLTF